MRPRVIGYGICGAGEAGRYMEATLQEFARLCDETVILLNNAGEAEKKLLEKKGFRYVEDNREWGRTQNVIKEEFVRNIVSTLNPDITVCLDMDEVFVNVTREKLEKECEKGYALYVYIVNLWNDGWRSDWSFSNVRIWNWKLKDELGEGFWKFENRPLHCGLAPKWCYTLNYQSPFVLEHSGLKKKEDRDRKIARYEKYDPRQTYRAPSYYEALKLDTAEPYDRWKVVGHIEREADRITQPLNKKPIMQQNKDKVLILREADGFVFDVPEKQVNMYLKQKYKGQGFRLIAQAPIVEKKNAHTPKNTLVYVAHHDQKDGDDTEGHITRSFEELGWNVIKVSETDKDFPEAEIMLYHKWIPPDYEGKKVCWYFDKIDFNGREQTIDSIASRSDFFFATDGDTDIEKAIILRQGVGFDCRGGKEIKAPDIAFTGSLYGEREEWAKKFKDYDFKAFNNVHRYELNDLCVSAKIMIAPPYPATDNYWSNRVYNTMGRGGFMLHPYCKGLLEEFEDGKHLVLYTDEEDMFKKIDYYLENDEEREAIRIAGRDLVREKYTYKERVKTLCTHLTNEN